MTVKWTQQSPHNQGQRRRPALTRAWRGSLGLLAGVLLAGFGITTAAYATDPGQLTGAGYVHDEADVLTSSEEASVQARLTQLQEDTGAEVFVVYVKQFTSLTDPADWANKTAEDSGLGPHQYLLAISTEGRQLYLSADSKGPLSEPQTVTAEQAAIASLKASDWAAAPIATAESMTQSLNPSSGGESSNSGNESAGGLTWVLMAITGIVVIVLLVMFLQRRKKKQRVEANHAESLVELERAAGSALVQTDDAIKTSTDELGFARAQFGDRATLEYEQVVAAAKKNLDAAFAIKQKLDDDVPDAHEQKVAWNTQIVQLLDQANTWLDEKAAKFDDLRKLEQNAPAALAAVTSLRDQLRASQTGAESAWAQLQARYAPAALESASGNIEEARLRLQFTDEQIALAAAAIASQKTAEAAVAIRASEDATSQVKQLQGALTTLGTDLSTAVQRSTALVAELQQDIATAQGLPDIDGRISQIIASTQAQIASAQSVLSQAQAQPLQAVALLDAANTAIDGVVDEVRDTIARVAHAKQQLADTVMSAQAKVSAAEDFITTRRGAVGATARTRLAEANASLNRCRELQTADPERAISEAQRAVQLADAAINAAQQDVGAFNQSGIGGGGNDVLSAVLGGVIINSIFGGGGGSNRRPSGGGFGGGFGGGGRSGGSSGSFGGGGTRSRRGGGRF